MLNKFIITMVFVAIAGASLAQNSKSGKGAPDYSNLYYWAAHPAKHDYSDSIPSFLKDEKRDTTVDVFFLYPTTFTNKILTAPINADVNDEELNHHTDITTILFQASIFNGSARVFSPRYRQAHLKAYFRDNDETKAAFDLAYSDLRVAFQYYLDHWNKGRPIIIAGHSQGSMHAIRLLKEFFDGTPLQKQLVCAYIPGWSVKANDFKNIAVGKSPTQTNCVLTWRSFKKGKADGMAGKSGDNSICVNPISWTVDNTPTTADMHKGAIGKNFNKLLAHTVTAEINEDRHIIWLEGADDKPVADDMISKLSLTGNLHVLDFNLFYLDVRENVKLRIKAYFNKPK